MANKFWFRKQKFVMSKLFIQQTSTPLKIKKESKRDLLWIENEEHNWGNWWETPWCLRILGTSLSFAKQYNIVCISSKKCTKTLTLCRMIFQHVGTLTPPHEMRPIRGSYVENSSGKCRSLSVKYKICYLFAIGKFPLICLMRISYLGCWPLRAWNQKAV